MDVTQILDQAPAVLAGMTLVMSAFALKLVISERQEAKKEEENMYVNNKFAVSNNNYVSAPMARPARASVRRWAEVDAAGVDTAGVVDASASTPPPPPPPPPSNDVLDVAVGQEGFNVKKMPGVVGPTGFFDPWGLSTKKTEHRIRWFREAELKHGRVAMLAALGYIVAENFHPLFGGNVDSPSYLAFQQTNIGRDFWLPMVLTLSAIESYSIRSIKAPWVHGYGRISDDHELGNLGFDPLGMKPKQSEKLLEMKNKELSNGRLAMLAVAGMVGQQLANGHKIIPTFRDVLLWNSPASAAESGGVEVEIARQMVDMLEVTQNM